MMIIPRTAYSQAIKKGIQALEQNEGTAHLAKKHEALLKNSVLVEQKIAEIVEAFKSPFAFSRIVEKSYQGGRYLFGSKMKVRQYKEFQMYGAKLEDGEWVADLDQLIVTFAITDEMMASAMTDSSSSTGFPVTVSGFMNTHFKQPTSVFIDSESQYTRTISNSDEYLDENIKKLEEAVYDIQDSSVRINKDYKNSVLSANNGFRKLVGDKLDFDLSCLLEALQRDSVSLYADILTNISAMLKNTATEDTLQLENLDFSKMSSLDYVLDFFMTKETYDLVMDFCEDVEKIIHLREKKDYEKSTVGTQIYSLKRFFKYTGYGSSRGQSFVTSNGLLTISSSGAGNLNFFGDNKDLSRYTSFSLSWGYVTNDGYGSIRYSDHVSMIRFMVTPVQYLELIQGVGTELFVKTTLSRFLGFETDSDEFDRVEHDKIKIPDIEDPTAGEKLVALTLELDSLMKTNSQSKAKREKVLELSNMIVDTATLLQEERKKIFFDEGEKLKDKVIENQLKDVANAFEVISSKRPDIKEKAKLILSSEVYRLGKK